MIGGAAVLARLHHAGVEVAFEAPANIRLRGPLTPALVDLARDNKLQLLALVRPAAHAAACACCGRFFMAEPATVCFWCRTKEHHDKSDESPAPEGIGIASVASVGVSLGPTFSRACPSCGAGLQPDDPEGATCWTCRSVPR